MNALETFPPFPGSSLTGAVASSADASAADEEHRNYRHAREFLSQLQQQDHARIGTLSLDEWEAATLYLVFAFKKM